MLGRPRVAFDAVSSTMTVLTELATLGASEGTTVVADYQHAGRGRSDRQWIAPPGSAVLASVLVRPDLAVDRLSPLSILVADAIRDALRLLYGLEALIKWPNDVLVESRKVSGVLIQTRAQAHGLAVIVGMGINANIPAEDLPPGATSLLVELGVPVDRHALLRGVLDALEVRYGELATGRLEHRWREIQAHLALCGEMVRVVEGETIVSGMLRGVDADGALALDVDGVRRRIVVGDLSRGPKPIAPNGNEHKS